MSVFLKVMCAMYAFHLAKHMFRLVRNNFPIVSTTNIGETFATCIECLGFLIWIIILINK